MTARQPIKHQTSSREQLIGVFADNTFLSKIERDLKYLKASFAGKQADEMRLTFNAPKNELENYLKSTSKFFGGSKNLDSLYNLHIKYDCNSVLVVPIKDSPDPLLIFKTLGRKLNSVEFVFDNNKIYRTAIKSGFFIYWKNKILERFPSQFNRQYTKKVKDSLFVGPDFFLEKFPELPLSTYSQFDYILKHKGRNLTGLINDALREISLIIEKRGGGKDKDYQKKRDKLILQIYKTIPAKSKNKNGNLPIAIIQKALKKHDDPRLHNLHDQTIRRALHKSLI